MALAMERAKDRIMRWPDGTSHSRLDCHSLTVANLRSLPLSRTGRSLDEDEPRWNSITFPMPNPKDSHPLLQACLHGAPSDVIRLVEEDKSRLDERDDGKMTPLITAVARGDADIVRTLLSFGIKVDEIDGHSTTALRYSSCLGLVEIVKLLLEAGANPRGRPEIGEWTPLHSAALGGHIDVARCHIERGALLFDERYAEQPIYTAGALNHLNFVQWALSLAPPSFQSKTYFKRDLIIHSIAVGAIDVVKWLVDEGCAGGDVDGLRTEHGLHLVQDAARTGSFEILRWLVDDLGLSPLALSPESNKLPIWLAIESGSLHCFDFLQSHISIDFDPSTSRDVSGRTCLMAAADAGSIKLFKRFIELNPDLEATDIDNNTALILASGNGKIELVRLCVDAGAKIDPVNKKGFSALSIALRHAHIAVANYLLSLPGYSYALMPDGSSILDFAIVAGDLDISKRIAALHPSMVHPKKHENVYGLWNLALMGGNIELVKWIEAEFGVDLKDPTLCDTLYECANGSKAESVRWIMQLKGVEQVQWRDANGRFSSGPVLRAMEGAISSSSSECLLALIEGGFELNSTEYETPPLHQACHAGELDLAKLLVEHGALLTLETDYGSILHYAAESDVMMLDWTIAELKALQARSSYIFNVDLPSPGLSNTAFMLSADRDIAQRLLDEGADATLQNSELENAAAFAAQLDRVDVLTLLKSLDCDFTLPNASGSLPIYIAAWNGSIAATEFLLLHTSAHAFTMDNVFLMAAYGDHLSFILHFIRNGTPLPSAFHKTCAQSGKALLYQRLFEDGRLPISDEALIDACAQGHYKMAKFLYHNGADLHALSPVGDTVMVSACRSRSLKLIKWLSSQGCSLDINWDSGSPVLDGDLDPGSEVLEWLSKELRRHR